MQQIAEMKLIACTVTIRHHARAQPQMALKALPGPAFQCFQAQASPALALAQLVSASDCAAPWLAEMKGRCSAASYVQLCICKHSPGVS